MMGFGFTTLWALLGFASPLSIYAGRFVLSEWSDHQLDECSSDEAEDGAESGCDFMVTEIHLCYWSSLDSYEGDVR